MNNKKDRHKNRTALDNRERSLRFRERKMAANGGRKRPFRHIFVRTNDEVVSIASKYTRLIDFRVENPAVYAVARRRGLVETFTWMSRGGGVFRWTRELCEAESHKYEGQGRSAFRDGCQGAYQASIRKGWIDSFVWLGTKQNPHTDNIYCVYRYVFEEQHAVYIGLTMNKAQRDNSHRNAPYGKKSAVLKFAEKNSCEVPKMDVLQDGMSCEQAQQCELDAVEWFKGQGWIILNKARTGVGVGSIGSVGKKWTQAKTYSEALKYHTRGEFYKHSPSAYEVARRNHWLELWFNG